MSEKVLFISKEGNASDIAARMVSDGADVKLCILSDFSKDNFNGMINKVKNWKKELKWADFIVFDDVSDIKEGNGIITAEDKSIVGKLGIPAYGMGHNNKVFTMGDAKVKFNGFSCAEALENNRSLFQDLVRDLKLGLTPDSLEFEDAQDAIEYLKKNKGPFVVKPEVHGASSSLTYVGEFENNIDTIGGLENLKLRKDSGKIKTIELQKRIFGIEVACSTWFNGKDPISVNINFEHKRFACGDKHNRNGMGFNTGETGTAMRYDIKNGFNNPLFKKSIEPLFNILSDFDYRGQFDINFIINKDGIYILEATPRGGYPAWYIEDSLQKTSWVDLLGAVATGSKIVNEVKDEWAIGAVVMAEGFPFWDMAKEINYGLPMLFNHDKDWKQFPKEDQWEKLHFCDVMISDKKDKQNQIILTGGYPVICTDTGKTLSECSKNIYDGILQKVRFNNSWYRPDIGLRVYKDVAELSKLGYDIGCIDSLGNLNEKNISI